MACKLYLNLIKGKKYPVLLPSSLCAVEKSTRGAGPLAVSGFVGSLDSYLRAWTDGHYRTPNTEFCAGPRTRD